MNSDDKAIEFAMSVLAQVPRTNQQELEQHLTGVLIVFWAALWGTFGTEYARGFIESQLRDMQTGQPPRPMQ